MTGSQGWRQEYLTEEQRFAAMASAVAAAEAEQAEATLGDVGGLASHAASSKAEVRAALAASKPQLKPLLDFLQSEGVQARAPWLADAYFAVTKVTGPLGAAINLAMNLRSARKTWSDPAAPPALKAAVGASTALAGASVLTAGRLSLAAFHALPMEPAAMVSLGRLAGMFGLAAGNLLMIVDAFNTVADPTTTRAQKGFSVLSAGMGSLLAVAVEVGAGAPLVVGLGVATAAFMAGKSLLARSPAANAFFSSVARAWQGTARALGLGGSKSRA